MNDALASFVSVTSFASLAVLTGVELAVGAFLHPIVNRLPAPHSVTGRVMSARRLGAVMPWWYAATTLLSGLTTVLAWRADGPVLPWGINTAVLVLVIVLSAAVLVPLNTSIAGRTAREADEGDGADIRRWDRLHSLRICMLASVVVMGAMALSR